MSKDKELANFVMDCYELEKNRSSDQSPLGPSTSYSPSSLLPAECAGSLDQPTSAAHGVISDHQECSPLGPGSEGETNTTDTGGAEPLNSVLLGDTVVEEYVTMENENAQGGHENYEEPGQQAEQEKQDFVLQMKDTEAENAEVVLIIKPAVISDHQYCSPVGPESEGRTNVSDAGGENYEIMSGDVDPVNTVPPGDTVVEEYVALEGENDQGGHENYGEPGQQAEQEKQGFVLHMTDTKAENTEVVLIIQPVCKINALHKESTADVEVRVYQPTMSSANMVVGDIISGNDLSVNVRRAVGEAIVAAQAVRSQREVIVESRQLRERQDMESRASEMADRARIQKKNFPAVANDEEEREDDDDEEESLDATVVDSDEVRKRRLEKFQQKKGPREPKIPKTNDDNDEDDDEDDANDSGTVTLKMTT